jgi:DNA repair protein RadA/Sms
MAKVKSAFFCQNCGTESAKWLGKCPGCNEWNTFVEEVVQKENKKDKILHGDSFKKNTKPHHISEITPLENRRYKLSNDEFNRV